MCRIVGWNNPENLRAPSGFEGDELTRGDSRNIDFLFGRKYTTAIGASDEIDGGASSVEFRFMVKVEGDFDGRAVVSNESLGSYVHDKLTQDQETLYRVSPNWITTKLNNLLGHDADGFQQEWNVYCQGDDAGSLGGKYFDLEDVAGPVRVWFDVAGGSSAPDVPDGGRLLEVDIATSDSATDVADALALVMDSDGEFDATATGTRVDIISVDKASRADADPGPLEWTIITWVVGSSPNGMADVAYVDLAAELQITIDGVVDTVRAWSIRVYNDYVKGTEGMVPGADPSYPAPGDLATDADAAISEAGNTNVGVTQFAPIHTLFVAVEVGAGVYTRTLTLLTTIATGGQVIQMRLAMPASTNPTIEVRNATSGGTVLHSQPGEATARTLQLTFVYRTSTGAWERVGAYYL